MSKNESQSNSSKEELLRTARERFKLAEDAGNDERVLALEDLKFRAGDQWPEGVKNERDQDGRPSLTINRIPQFIRQITNDQRQNRPSIKVSPVDDNADVETAKILQGLIRHIEYNSNADLAYDTAFGSAVTSGFGFFRIVTDYVDPMSFEQEILIKRIRNPFQVYLDPHSKEPDGSDANWGFIFEDVSKEDYQVQYKETELSKVDDWESIGNELQGWASQSSCRIAEYFYKEYKDVTIVQLSSGEVIDKAVYEKTLQESENEPLMIDELGRPVKPVLPEVVSERKTKVPVIKWCKINGKEVLEETEWPGQWIPIIPVYGDELDVNGKRILEGVVRHAKDSQRMYNYWKSTETETIALSPRAPFIAAEGQIPKEYEYQWRTANKKNHAVLTYKPTALNGALVGAPQRNVFEPPVQAITNASMMAAEDLKATTGIYDAALGARSNENSGIAIQRRNAQSQTSNFHFVDNLTRSIKHAGKILVDLIPKIYDTARAARILGEDGEQQIVYLNKAFLKDGKSTEYNLNVGKYDVAVETGPNFATKRQEALASLLEVTKIHPQFMQIAGDLIAKNMDWPGATEFAERIKKTIPPNLLDDKSQPQEMPPEAQAKMEQMGQMIEALTGKLNQATEVIKNKTNELESKERIEMMKIEADLKKEIVKVQGKASLEILNQEILDINKQQQLRGAYQPIDDQSQNLIPNQNQSLNSFNGSGLEQAVNPEDEQQPTGGLIPGQYMGE